MAAGVNVVPVVIVVNSIEFSTISIGAAEGERTPRVPCGALHRSAVAVWRPRATPLRRIGLRKVRERKKQRKGEKMSKSKKKQGKAEVNENLEEFSKTEKKTRKKGKVGKSRYFSFMTYASEKEIQTTIAKHTSSIRAFAYIYHDRDESPPHYHLLVRTYSSWTENQILKWFDWVKLKTGQNTLVEILDNSIGMNAYLTHTDYESVMKKKYPYKREEIKDFGLFDIVDKRNSFDETYEIVNNVLLGMSEKDLVRRYGKNYLFHRNAFHESANEIIYQSSLLRSEIKENIYNETRMLEIDTDAVDLGDLLDDN